MSRLKGKRALVTGAAGGLGKAIAERYVAEGARVMLCDIQEAAVRASAAAIKQPSFKADVSMKAEVDALVAATVKEFGGIDILVNNAGTTVIKDFFDVTEDDWDKVLDTNLKGPFMLAQAAARHMVKQKSGVIINMASIHAVVAIPDHVPYGASKGGLKQLTTVMALALAPHGIRVCGIGPGTIVTDMAKKVLTDPVAEQKILSRTPIGRYGQPEEIASVALFLASDDASYMTGTTIYPDGGRLALNYTVPVQQKK